MVKKIYLVVTVFILLLLSSLVIYQQFKKQKEAAALDFENIEFTFQTTTTEEGEILDIDVLRYSDATFIDLVITAVNKGDKDLSLNNLLARFYLEDVFVVEETKERFIIPAGSERVLDFQDLTFKSELIDEALNGRIMNPEMTLDLLVVITSEYSFEVQNVKLKTYRPSSTAGAKILLREIFGGKSKEEAAEEILKLSNI